MHTMLSSAVQYMSSRFEYIASYVGLVRADSWGHWGALPGVQGVVDDRAVSQVDLQGVAGGMSMVSGGSKHRVRYLSLAVHTGQGVLSPVLVKLPHRLPIQSLSVVILIKALLQVGVTTVNSRATSAGSHGLTG